MLYRNIPYKNREKKEIPLKDEIINILSSYGLCPLCFNRLLDKRNGGYIGKTLFFDVDNQHYVVITCDKCKRKIKKRDYGKLKMYLDEIELELSNTWNDTWRKDINE